MAKVITTTEISFCIEKIIIDAKVFVVLVTPYLKIHSRLKSLIEAKVKESNLVFTIVCREKDLPQAEKAWLSKYPMIRIFYQDILHAKCYLNENNALLTSMKL